MSLTIKKILVPIDFSEISVNAIDYAALIAKKFDAGITLLHIVESYKFNTALKVNPKMNLIIRDGIKVKLKKLIKKSEPLKGLVVKRMITDGKIYNEIVNTAKKKKFDLVVMGTHGTSTIREFEKFMLGSNAYRVVHGSPCPVITVRDKKTKTEFKNILLPLDMTKETTQKVGLAVALAKTFNSNIHIVSVSTSLDELTMDLENQMKRLNEVKELLKASKIRFTAHLMRDMDISQGILFHAQKVRADLIVILTKEENRLKEFLIGSNAREIITHSKIPVLSVIPERHSVIQEGTPLYKKKETIHGEFAVKETLPFYY